jgi:pyrroloquinoline quinone biosynthesis protein B
VTWFLVNASPDIASQIESLPAWANVPRAARFDAILLSNADLDHTLGLLTVREGGPVTVYASDAVRSSIVHAFEGLLARHYGDGRPGMNYRTLNHESLELLDAEGGPAGLFVHTILMDSAPPRYSGGGPPIKGHACAFVIEETGGGRFVCALDVPGPTDELIREISAANLTLFDGSFWSDTEMIELGLSSRTAHEMGHWPIGGSDGSLRALGDFPPGKLVYSHINNTNPVLDPTSAPRQAVERTGAVVGEDGMEWKI